MAEMTIRLRCDSETGKKDIVVSLRSNADALPQEHDKLHRELVEKLIQDGLLHPSEVGQIVVEREQPTGELASSPSEPHPRQAQKQGG